MSAGDKTKVELLEENGALKQRLADLEATRPAAPKYVAEASVLQGCIQAMDQLPTKLDGGSYVTAWTAEAGYTARVVGASAADRVLRYLATKYGVALVEIQLRDCARKHVDELDYMAMQNALQGLTR